MESHQDKVKEIIKNANEFAEQEFSLYSMYSYINQTLWEYHKVQAFKTVEPMFPEWDGTGETLQSYGSYFNGDFESEMPEHLRNDNPIDY